jgi:hypothetical protein
MHSATPTVYEPSRKNSRDQDSAAPETSGSQRGIDVAAAEEEFNNLQRTLSRPSQHGRDVEKQVRRFALDGKPTI